MLSFGKARLLATFTHGIRNMSPYRHQRHNHNSTICARAGRGLGGVNESTAGFQSQEYTAALGEIITQAGTMTMRKYSKAGLSGATQVTVPSIQ